MSHYPQLLEQIASVAKRCGRNPKEITLVAVTKSQSLDDITQVYQEGCRDFGENRVQEALPKLEQIPNDVNWHFIGRLQSNKVSKVVPNFSLIHSVDTPELAIKIAKEAEKNQKVQQILLQVNVSGEKSKTGLSPETWEKSISSLIQIESIGIEGLMMIAPLVENRESIRIYFKRLRQLRDRWKKQFRDSSQFIHLSMGMTNDFEIAIEEGATILRIGRAIFQKD